MNTDIVYGAIAGDIAGSQFEGADFSHIQYLDIESKIKEGHFTDDTVLTVAVIDALKNDRGMYESFKDWATRYYNAGFSKNFKENIIQNEHPEYSKCHSSSNGALMMLSGFAALEDAYDVKKVYEAVNVTHNCTECRKLAFELIEYCKNNNPLDYVRVMLSQDCMYENLTRERKFDISAFGTLREAMIIFKASSNYDDAISKALYLGGDADTRACIVGMIAGSRMGVPSYIIDAVKDKLPGEMIKIIEQ